jgi:hypothetical protein
MVCFARFTGDYFATPAQADGAREERLAMAIEKVRFEFSDR